MWRAGKVADFGTLLWGQPNYAISLVSLNAKQHGVVDDGCARAVLQVAMLICVIVATVMVMPRVLLHNEFELHNHLRRHQQ